MFHCAVSVLIKGRLTLREELLLRQSTRFKERHELVENVYSSRLTVLGFLCLWEELGRDRTSHHPSRYRY